jgi:deoxycytidylate deaminase
MYKLQKSLITGEIKIVQKQIGDVLYSIPFAPDNTDYAQFKVDLSEGVTLLDAEGVEMTPEQVQEFLETLP